MASTASALVAATDRCASAFPTDAPDPAVNAYLKAFVRTEGDDSFIVLDSVSTSGKINNWSSTYNQGTFVGLAHFLGDTANAKRAADYTMNKMGKANASGFMIMPEYQAGGGDLAGFHSIGLRWISRFMKDRKLEATYLPWLQANADAAWNVRRTSDNLSWCRWLEPTPEGVLHSWDTISSVVALQVVPPSETTPKP